LKTIYKQQPQKVPPTTVLLIFYAFLDVFNARNMQKFGAIMGKK